MKSNVICNTARASPAPPPPPPHHPPPTLLPQRRLDRYYLQINHKWLIVPKEPESINNTVMKSIVINL